MPLLMQMKNRRQETRTNIFNQSKDIAKVIKDLRKELDDLLNKTEGKTVEELDTLLKATDDNLLGDVNHCQNLHEYLTEVVDLDTRDLAQTSKSFAFMCFERSKRMVWEAEGLLKDRCNKDFELRFKADERLKKTLEKTETVGLLSLIARPVLPDSQTADIFAVKDFEKYSVETPGDADVCYIRGVCGLPNGDIVITDCNNNKVKLLDENFCVLSQCDLPPRPRDVCYLGNDSLAVTVCDQQRKEIQLFQSKERKLSQTGQISLTHDCYGLVHHKDHLYVASHTALYLYTMDGQLVQKLYEDSSEMFTIWRVAVADDGQKIYIADYSYDRLVILDNKGGKLTTFSDRDLEGPSGICVTDNGTVLVCGENSNTVVQVDKDGKKKLATLVNNTKRISRPEALWFNREASKLIVGQDNNRLLVITLCNC